MKNECYNQCPGRIAGAAGHAADRKVKGYVSDSRHHVSLFLYGVSVFVVVCATVLVVRAYLTAQTTAMVNPFAPMTYTDINIGEVVTEPTGTTLGTDLVVNKKAFITVAKTSQLKPVFVRAAINWAIYDDAGDDAVNITALYPTVTVQWNPGDEWTPINASDGTPFYYYKKIVLPEYTSAFSGDGSTTSVIKDGDVTVKNANLLPDGAQVRINVIADCVQAVSVDTARWKEQENARFSTTEVQQAWGIAPSGTMPSVTATGDALAITWPTT